MDVLQMMAQAVIFILPSYFANSIPVLLGGGAAIDGGRKFSDGNRLFGDGKTIRGFFAGIFAALLVGSIQAVFLPGTAWDIYGGNPHTYVYAGLLLGTGTMIGDLAGSFIKRRQGVARGKQSVILDQLTFLFVALAFAYPIASRMITIEAVVFLFILTYFAHVAANVLAHKWGLKKVPW
ncbi:MAG: CDP-2,3-bis-(O-geranylgeranyl)-sn-glycerol synthase [Candidatus Micrarchaeia archaeon]|jgi:CDP-2,3-bis-(O-geranylgeranyl)-sn-glycerol synthase